MDVDQVAIASASSSARQVLTLEILDQRLARALLGVGLAEDDRHRLESGPLRGAEGAARPRSLS
jgi:hypothetical protein